MSQLLDDLRAARARIEHAENWVTGSAAVTAGGAPVYPTDAFAVRFCAVGACFWVAGLSQVLKVGGRRTPAGDRLDNMLSELTKQLEIEGKTTNIALFNDTRTHEDVVTLFSNAIKRLENESGS